MPSPSLTGFAQTVVVGVADLAVSNNPNVVLATYSLGSCIGISIFDPVTKAGGLLHVMLPDSDIDPAKAAVQPAMFMDTGVAALFRASYGLHADKHRVQICAAGGAQVMDPSGFFSIGKRNYEALTRLLRQHSLQICAEQVGGLVSRSMYLDLATGRARLKVSGQAQEVILWNP
jgi:chemotaxis protein CheD